MALPYNRRTHTCGELRASHIDREVLLAGWVANHRDHKGMIFIDLRDRYGVTQLRFGDETPREVFERAKEVGLESCVCVRGKVAHRGDGPHFTQVPHRRTAHGRNRGSRHRV